MERERIQGLPKFLKYPLLSQEWEKLRTSNLADIFRVPCEQKPITNLGENGAWAYPETVHFFEYPLLFQERVKLQTSNFVRTFLVLFGTKVHYKFLEK